MDSNSSFRFETINPGWAREIATWQYHPPYEMYSFKVDEFEENLNHLLNPVFNYFCAIDERGDLVGYSCFGEDAQVMGGDYEAEALDVGVGLRPELTGQGLGLSFMEASLDFAREQFRQTALRATVAAFNLRSLRVCEKAGFREVQRFARPQDQVVFVVLVRDA